MGSCLSLESFWKESDVVGTEDEGYRKLTVMLSAARKMVGVWVHPLDTMKQVDERIRTKYRILDLEWYGEAVAPKLMMHRFGRTASIEWDVTVEEAKSRHLRYHIITDIAAEYSTVSGLSPVTRRNHHPFRFTTKWLKRAENQVGDGISSSTYVYEI